MVAPGRDAVGADAGRDRAVGAARRRRRNCPPPTAPRCWRARMRCSSRCCAIRAISTLTFAYADVSAKLGDNEAAVSALERMLLFNPNLPRVQLELGALYFRMGSVRAVAHLFRKSPGRQPAARGQSRASRPISPRSRG